MEMVEKHRFFTKADIYFIISQDALTTWIERLPTSRFALWKELVDLNSAHKKCCKEDPLYPLSGMTMKFKILGTKADRKVLVTLKCDGLMHSFVVHVRDLVAESRGEHINE
jgi:hypothetical protein